MHKQEKLLAVTLGGHAVMPPGAGSNLSYEGQEAWIESTVAQILQTVRKLVASNYKLRILSHGSGPQTGIIMERSAISAKSGMHELPLRAASMDLIATLGMTIQLAIRNTCLREGMTLAEGLGEDTTGVAVNPTSFIVDPETMNPTKPIGMALSEADAARKIREGESVADLDGKGKRVIVPSPNLLETFEFDLDAIASNIYKQILSIAAGTGGRALIRDDNGILHAKDAVIDKDRALARLLIDLLEKDISFDTTAIITDAPYVVRDFSKVRSIIEKAGGLGKIKPEALRAAYEKGGPIHQISVDDMFELLQSGIESGAFAGGAIAKIEAACQMVQYEGAYKAVICNADNFAKTIQNPTESSSGTTINRGARWV
ncbi:MAG: hypothetical protein O3B47_01345 [bacterium]|nr:hypothetical protein [bacterium]